MVTNDVVINPPQLPDISIVAKYSCCALCVRSLCFAHCAPPSLRIRSGFRRREEGTPVNRPAAFPGAGVGHIIVISLFHTHTHTHAHTRARPFSLRLLCRCLFEGRNECRRVLGSGEAIVVTVEVKVRDTLGGRRGKRDVGDVGGENSSMFCISIHTHIMCTWIFERQQLQLYPHVVPTSYPSAT